MKAKRPGINDTKPLALAARSFGKAMVQYHKALDAHAKNHGLDEWHSKRVKTENRVFHTERAKEARKDDLIIAALLFADGDAADIGLQFAQVVEYGRKKGGAKR